MSNQASECGILFTYSTQRLPNPGSHSDGILGLHGDTLLIEVFDLPLNYLDSNGRPNAEALWCAECEFLKRVGDFLHPDERLVSWEAHLANDPSVLLSEYRLFLPARNY